MNLLMQLFHSLLSISGIRFFGKNNSPEGQIFSGGLFFILISPPMSQIDELFRERMTKWREAIARFWSILEKDSECDEFCESICENLRICFSDISTNTRECCGSIIDRLQYENYPFFTKESKESLSMWTSTLWRSDHIPILLIYFF